jgi:hypothetical protein
VRDILNIMHNMPSALIGISSRTAEAIRATKLGKECYKIGEMWVRTLRHEQLTAMIMHGG